MTSQPGSPSTGHPAQPVGHQDMSLAARRARALEKYGQEFLDAIDRNVAAAPDPSPEVVARLRALFATARPGRLKRPA